MTEQVFMKKLDSHKRGKLCKLTIQCPELNIKSKQIKDIRFKNCNFSYSYFTECEFVDVIFENCNFNSSEFINCKLEKTQFIGCSFQRGILNFNSIFSSSFCRSNMYFATMQCLDAWNFHIEYCHLIDGDLYLQSERCYLYGCNFTESNVTLKNFEVRLINNCDFTRCNTKRGQFKNIIQASGIGVYGRLVTYFIDEDYLQSGCFRGTMREAVEYIKTRLIDDDKDYKEHMALIEYFKHIKELRS